MLSSKQMASRGAAALALLLALAATTAHAGRDHPTRVRTPRHSPPTFLHTRIGSLTIATKYRRRGEK